MKQLPLIIGVIIVGLLAAGGYYFYTQNSAAKTEATVETTSDTAEGKPVSGMMSLKELMSLGQSQKCTFNYTDPDTGATSGTSYISGEKVRTDFMITDPDGQKIDGGMIMANSTMYTWTSATGTGVKMEISQSMEQKIEDGVESTEYNQNYIDPDAELDYNCTAWREDPAMFIPPSDVEFMDLSEQMKQLENLQKSFGSEGSDNPAANCAICDSMPQEAAAACRSSLKCE